MNIFSGRHDTELRNDYSFPGYCRLSILSLVFLFACYSEALPGNFQVEPTTLELSSSARSGAFTVINNGTEKLNIQVDVEEWNQDAEGKDVYSKTGDIVFFPKIMSIEPNEQRAIRLGIKGALSTKEKAYRIFVEEIPSQPKPQDAKADGHIPAGITIALRYAVPVFLKPAKIQESGIVEKMELSRGVAKMIVRNSGNIHIKLLNTTFRGKAADGRQVFTKDVGGWYILQGLSRKYETAVPKESCGDLATIEINAQFETFSKAETLKVNKAMCAE